MKQNEEKTGKLCCYKQLLVLNHTRVSCVFIVACQFISEIFFLFFGQIINTCFSSQLSRKKCFDIFKVKSEQKELFFALFVSLFLSLEKCEYFSSMKMLKSKQRSIIFMMYEKRLLQFSNASFCICVTT